MYDKVLGVRFGDIGTVENKNPKNNQKTPYL
jgi:hypothetical protein